MFFRARVVRGEGMLFDPELRVAGDAEWMVRLLKRGIRMATLGRFTSAFTVTGENMSVGANATRERQELFGRAPVWARALRPAFVVHHRLRRLAGGMYRQRAFSYDLYTSREPAHRLEFAVANPTYKWPQVQAS